MFQVRYRLVTRAWRSFAALVPSSKTMDRIKARRHRRDPPVARYSVRGAFFQPGAELMRGKRGWLIVDFVDLQQLVELVDDFVMDVGVG